MGGIPIIVSNYLHDVATAVLLSSAAFMWILGRRAEAGNAEARALLARAYPVLTISAWGSIAWIVVGGVPRIVYFSRVEWDPEKMPGLVVALGIKHAVMFAAVATGVFLWRRMKRSLPDHHSRPVR